MLTDAEKRELLIAAAGAVLEGDAAPYADAVLRDHGRHGQQGPAGLAPAGDFGPGILQQILLMANELWAAHQQLILGAAAGAAIATAQTIIQRNMNRLTSEEIKELAEILVRKLEDIQKQRDLAQADREPKT